MTKVLGFGRISTKEGQDVSSQRTALEQHGVVVVFSDAGNGSKLDGRLNLETALSLLDKGDVPLTLHLDRVARDTCNLLVVARCVVEQGALLRIVDLAIVSVGEDIVAEMMLTRSGRFSTYKRTTSTGVRRSAKIDDEAAAGPSVKERP